jgi:hypothetical protein
LGGPKVRDHWEDLGVGGRMILRLTFREIGIDGENWSRLAQDRCPVVGFCEHGNEPSGSIKSAGYSLTSRVTISFPNNVLHHEVSEWVSKYEVGVRLWTGCIWLRIGTSGGLLWTP